MSRSYGRREVGLTEMFWLLVLGIAIVYLVMFFGGRSTGAEAFLVEQGYTNIEMTGYRPYLCARDDVYAEGFTARNLVGNPVSGAVCSGPLKGKTIRLD